MTYDYTVFTMNPLKKPPVKRDKCGTHLGARQHMYKNENLCEPCDIALKEHRKAYAKELRKKNPEYAERHRADCRIMRAALRELKIRHQDEFDEIFAEIRSMEDIYNV